MQGTDFRYMSGFGGYFETEAVEGALPKGRNSPQRPAFGLYAEQLSGSAFTAPRHENRRSWLYRLRPSADHRPFVRYQGAKLFAPGTVQEPLAPNRLRWNPPSDLPEGADFVDGMVTMLANRDPSDLEGVAVHLYRAQKSMENRVFAALADAGYHDFTVAQARAEKLGIANVRFRQIDAESIDQPAASLDGVLCRWGYMLMADPEAALRETRRILKPGARLALAAWAGPAENPWASLPMGELVERGHVERPEPGAPGQFRWARPGTIEEHLDAAGFTEYEVDTVDFANVYPSVDAWVATNRDCSMMLRSALEQLDPAEREDVIAAIREKALPFVREDGSAVVPARTWVAVAAA